MGRYVEKVPLIIVADTDVTALNIVASLRNCLRFFTGEIEQDYSVGSLVSGQL